jgi:acyl-CoA thioesterase FadM
LTQGNLAAGRSWHYGPLVTPARPPGPISAPFPPAPVGTPRATAKVALRFEDVTQDGRLVLEALPTALGPTVFRGLLQDDPGARACFEHGVMPIISRFVMEGTNGPFSANRRVEAEGTYRIVRSEDGRFMLDMWASLYAPLGRTHGPPPPEGAERVLAGRVLAEHVFTRPFAPAGARRVTSFDFEGAPDVRETRSPPPPFESIASVPSGAVALDSSLRLDPTPITFGLCHTDSNMHVNSLAYLRVFEEAALRRFAELGRGSVLLARKLDIAYRKPCFAGQKMHVAQQAFESDGKLGIAAVLVDAQDAASDEALAHARPHVFVRMDFDS